MTKQSRNRYSIDGFVPNSQVGQNGQNENSRQIGFDARQPNNAIARHRLTGRRQPTTYAAAAEQYSRQSGTPEPTGLTSTGALPGASSQRRSSRSNNKLGQPKSAAWLRRANWKKVLKRTATLAAVFLLLAAGWLGWQFYENSSKVFGGDTNLLGFLQSKKLRGEDQGQVNILIGGVSTDNPGHQGSALTDSIMMISLDTKTNKAFLLSIPRDLWVDIPGYGYGKINAANAYGDEDNFSEAGLPSGGMGLLAKVINESFELPVHYYAKVNYGALRDAVDAVGGITVDIKSSDKRGLFDPNINYVDKGPLKLANGPQKLDGQTALNLARARGDPTNDGRVAYGFERSDFTRTMHQRQMILALKERISSGSVVTNPLKVGQLFDVVGKNTKTDFEPSEIRRLYDINKLIKQTDVSSISLNDVDGVNMLASYRTRDGASALIPAAGLDDFSQIQVLLKKLMSTDPVVKESASIVILNGGDITGLASKESNNLTSKGLNVVAIGDTPRQAGANVLIDQTAQAASPKPGTKALLQKQFATAAAQNMQNDLGYPTADFIIILGTNHKLPAGESGE